MDNIYLLPAALFPAIPLMMISFGNRYTTLATLIRKIHDDLMSRNLTKEDPPLNSSGEFNRAIHPNLGMSMIFGFSWDL